MKLLIRTLHEVNKHIDDINSCRMIALFLCYRQVCKENERLKKQIKKLKEKL